MKMVGFILLGMVIAYLLLFLGETGLVLLGGAIFGLLLYIAKMLSSKNNNRRE
ncbi:hypothetical protein [Paenibacillus nanensis]|uniref:hypothetical protein n=1 Tax=Paenibacillus nanensis TaxID=393251 RepID=UPI0013C367B7|nr:hypothetical protein [Paenibacillus nanensis]